MFDREQLEAVVEAVCEQLDGDWLVIGGAMAALWFAPRRVTEDVDIIGLRGEAAEVAARRDELRRLVAGKG